MRTTVTIDDELLNTALEYSDIKEVPALIRKALQTYVHVEAGRRLARLGGTQPGLQYIRAGGRPTSSTKSLRGLWTQKGKLSDLDRYWIWINHIDHTDPILEKLVEVQEVLMHPFVIGEISLGTLREPDLTLRELGRLPSAYPVDDNEVIEMIVGHKLHGVGIGYVDAHLVATCLLADETWLWTNDRRLKAIAARLGVDATTA